MSLTIQIDTPLVSVKEFSARSGIPIRSIQAKIRAGELPVCDMRLNKDKRGSQYINMIKLSELANAGEFNHPGLNRS